MSDLGGDPACWAHLFESDLVTNFDDHTRDAGADGAVWSLPHRTGLDANIVRLGPHGAIGAHVNDAVDVLVVVWAGEGELEIDEQRMPLRPGTIALVERGARRGITAGTSGLTYLSTHPRRDGLAIGPRPH